VLARELEEPLLDDGVAVSASTKHCAPPFAKTRT
jgi:hypothetical protein